MKLKLKKYLFLLNDITSLILRKEDYKDKIVAEEQVSLFKKLLFILSFLLIVSVIINIVFLLK